MGSLLHDTTALSLLVGFITPLLTALLQQPRWTGRTRVMVGWGVAVVLGLLTSAQTGALGNAKSTAQAVMLVLVTAQATYTGWKKTGVAPAIEAATSNATVVAGEVVPNPEPDAPRKPRKRATKMKPRARHDGDDTP